jgi:hypothetical protein
MDYVTRLLLNAKTSNLLEKAAVASKKLPSVTDYFYKPKGESLSDFSPRKMIVRKRIFQTKETLFKIHLVKQEVGYCDEKEPLLHLNDYELWGKSAPSVTEYKVKIGDEIITVLKEKFSFGQFIKIEAASVAQLKRTVRYFNPTKDELIEKNSAELLFEHNAV